MKANGKTIKHLDLENLDFLKRITTLGNGKNLESMEKVKITCLMVTFLQASIMKVFLKVMEFIFGHQIRDMKEAFTKL
jgi:hypothetical protein